VTGKYSCANAVKRQLEYIGRRSDSKKVFENLLFGKASVFPFCIGHAGLPTRIWAFCTRNGITLNGFAKAELSVKKQILFITQ
jgi:hypothetical protein